MAKIHVVGCGPAGSIAAMSALRSGHEVVISEDHPVSGLPENCSGLFSRDGLESLSGFIDYRGYVIRPIHGADIHLGDQSLTIRRSEPVGFVCDRAAMDSALAQNAADAGAVINYGERVRGAFRSDNIIGADGPLSTVARLFNFPRIPRFASTLQSLVPYRAEDPDAVEVFLSNSVFPGFFGWIIPHDEYTAEFGAGVLMPDRPLEAWKKLLRRKGVDGAHHPRGAIIPLSVRPRTAMRTGRTNILLAGDAAGQVKSTTGGGVIFGGNCASIAGRFAAEPARYEAEWRLRFGPDLAMHGMVHDYLRTRTDAELSALGRKLKKLNFDGYLSNHGHMDRPTKMLRPELFAHMLRNII
ncbi:MAG: NAD(P)/FAD-dependent oxidoreductase [Candidatus Micrarchaeia archaeon]